MKPAILTLALLFAIPAEAGPLAWVKRHPVASRVIGSVVADGLLARGMYNAGIPNVENRQCHYGPAAGCYAIDVGLNVVMDIVGYKVGGKIGDAISYGGDAVEIGYAGWQWHGGPNKSVEENSETHIDFSRVVLVHH